MKKALLFIIAGLWLATGTLYAQPSSPSPKPMSHAFDSMLQSLLAHSVQELKVEECPSPTGAVVYLDARAQSEYEVSHIPNAKWVGYMNFQKKAVKALDKSQPIVVYCSVGYRSEKITEKLRSMGFSNVSNLYGGIFAWKNQGRKVVDAEGKETEKVHTYNEEWGQWLELGEKVH